MELSIGMEVVMKSSTGFGRTTGISQPRSCMVIGDRGIVARVLFATSEHVDAILLDNHWYAASDFELYVEPVEEIEEPDIMGGAASQNLDNNALLSMLSAAFPNIAFDMEEQPKSSIADEDQADLSPPDELDEDFDDCDDWVNPCGEGTDCETCACGEGDEPEVEVDYIVTRSTATLIFDGSPEVIDSSNPNFGRVCELIADEEFVLAMELICPAVGITTWGNGMLDIEHGEIKYHGHVLSGKLCDRIINLMGAGDLFFERLAKFLTLVQEQASFRTRMALMDFVAHDKMGLTEEGHVIAFKNVRADFRDKHSGKFDNSVGASPSMPRAMVDDDPDNTCSAGLHVCSPTYLSGFWGTEGRTMKVVVDPRDFVALPEDYNQSKARVCRYTVVEDVSSDIHKYLDGYDERSEADDEW